MKKLTAQFLCLTMVIMAISVTETFAQRIRFKNGKVTVRANVKANGKNTYTVSEKDFNKLTIRQIGEERFKYEIRRGRNFLSSGHTTGLSMEVESDGRSVYSITIINEANIAKRIILSFQQTGGGSPKV